MRTNIVIDPRLMKAAQSATGLSTKKKIVEEGLKLLASKAQDRHPAYTAWKQRSRKFAALAREPAILSPIARSSDPIKMALDAKYRR